MKNEVYLTILFPCLNEEKTIEKCILEAKKYLKDKKFTSEILVVDNGSTDDSKNICKRLNIRLIIEKEKGYGCALRRGINESRGKYTLMLDSDYTYSLENVDSFLNKIEQGYDLVVGNRFTGLMEKGAMPLLNKYIGNPILSFLGKILFPCNINDFHCGIRLYDTSKIKKLNLNSCGMEYASEMIAMAVKNNLKLAEVPTKLRCSPYYRIPHLRPIRDSIRHIKLLIRLKICYNKNER